MQATTRISEEAGTLTQCAREICSSGEKITAQNYILVK
jgi:hypothetical protein